MILRTIRRIRDSYTTFEDNLQFAAAVVTAAEQPPRTVTWTTGDGGRVPVADMTDSHLFDAIAKAERGEYPDSHSRRTGVRSLKREALRRLMLDVVGS